MPMRIVLAFSGAGEGKKKVFHFYGNEKIQKWQWICFY
ncbi:hypothetical protein B4110_1059 [Parageobacillus toebii]|uniref:Uncharacterized protein n=1 Tax=Parageobacillus toebii TaxID=153151 RepID=A0A150MYF5_9BACL|nr:hypothetical protein B4110_1059 [Parageobacillus toebii]